MIDALLNNATDRMLEQTLSFTEQRHNVLLEDLANVSTPGYVQKDLSVGDFQSSLRKAIDVQRASTNDYYEPESTPTVGFEPGGSSVAAKPAELPMGTAFHDRGVRSMEYLMGQMADNALAHNMTAQFLKQRYDILQKAITLRA